MSLAARAQLLSPLDSAKKRTYIALGVALIAVISGAVIIFRTGIGVEGR